MAQCFICHIDIPKGEKYKGERYKNISVCSEACYNELCHIKDNTPKKEPYPDYNKLTDLIRDKWGGSENVNWMLAHKQIKYLVEKKDLTCLDLYGIITYAIKYEGLNIDTDYGLGQVFPKYIEPYFKFKEQVEHIREIAKETNMENNVVYDKPIKQKRKKIKMEEDW